MGRDVGAADGRVGVGGRRTFGGARLAGGHGWGAFAGGEVVGAFGLVATHYFCVGGRGQHPGYVGGGVVFCDGGGVVVVYGRVGLVGPGWAV